ncbi:baculoviral IAP repeat-containing protein 2-like [Mercenaria mercenaria]|uniref:baculoviral IAP repeat-containing protein 2-like n=1 Tax=Mercenaria mercenaria TaxID=6596 RepID=UPI00234F6EB6|nr:baculoviral IAP repeat-containing protein 2-like [Mercenaria mercenaria]
MNTKHHLPVPSVDTETLSHFDPLMKVIDKIANGQRVPPQITMQYEMLRFCTLRSYPKENKPFITRIAQAGFYYANSGDELVCYCCARRKSNWSESDIPMDVHRQMNPNCRFLVCNSTVNVPIKPVQILRYPLLTSSHENNSPNVNSTETSIEYQPQNRTNEKLPVVNETVESTIQSTTKFSTVIARRNTVQTGASTASMPSHSHHLADHVTRLSVVTSCGSKSLLNSLNSSGPPNYPLETTASNTYPAKCYKSSNDERKQAQQNDTPKYPKYSSRAIRLASFNECGDVVISPGCLAETGFFYAGFGDCVRCFHCGVGLRHWSEEDDPWIEHSRWSKDCVFVKQMRGQEFVNLVQMAVQYSQNHDQNGNKTPTDNMTAATQGRDVIENLLHSDAAQSVLEMGYHPDVIRSAIGQILELNDRPYLTAVKLMEKIFAIEEGENFNRAEQNATQERDHCALETEDKREKTEQYNAYKSGTRAKDINKNVAVLNTSRAETKPTSSISSDNSDSLSARYSNISKSKIPGCNQISERKRIKEENANLKQQSVCTKCKQNDVCIVFLPCGHLVTCEGCAPSLRYCSVQTCGKYIKGTVRTYLA